jgi:hypothetical protein
MQNDVLNRYPPSQNMNSQDDLLAMAYFKKITLNVFLSNVPSKKGKSI